MTKLIQSFEMNEFQNSLKVKGRKTYLTQYQNINFYSKFNIHI